jgi:hypothetical protein
MLNAHTCLGTFEYQVSQSAHASAVNPGRIDLYQNSDEAKSLIFK